MSSVGNRRKNENIYFLGAMAVKKIWVRAAAAASPSPQELCSPPSQVKPEFKTYLQHRLFSSLGLGGYPCLPFCVGRVTCVCITQRTSQTSWENLSWRNSVLMFSKKCPLGDLGNLAGWSCCFGALQECRKYLRQNTCVCREIVLLAAGENAALRAHPWGS